VRFDREMSSAQRLVLTLEVDPASDPITGSVGVAHGDTVEFLGWLGFAAALEQLLSAQRRSAPAVTPAAPVRREPS